MCVFVRKNFQELFVEISVRECISRKLIFIFVFINEVLFRQSFNLASDPNKFIICTYLNVIKRKAKFVLLLLMQLISFNWFSVDLVMFSFMLSNT